LLGFFLLFEQLENTDFFSQFLSDPAVFVSFLQNHWDGAEIALFTFQLQLICRELPARNGKEHEKSLKCFTMEFGFHAVGPAFNGDSGFNNLHNHFYDLS
jgi:hypothetical protein